MTQVNAQMGQGKHQGGEAKAEEDEGKCMVEVIKDRGEVRGEDGKLSKEMM